MTADDIQHLATLARIELAPEEAAQLASEFDAILGYVAAVQEISADAADAPAHSSHRNVFREDVETHAPGEYTAALLAQAPAREGSHVRVKKILGNSNGGS